MQKSTLTSVIFVGLVLAVAIPTGAVVAGPGGSDDVWEQNGVVLKPAPGPNGEYAEINAAGNLSINLTDPGVNLNATTRIDGIFVVENTGDTEARVWFTHDGIAGVTVVDSTAGQPLQGQRNVRLLESGEKALVGIRVDTTGADLEAGDSVLNSIRLHVRTPDEEETTTQPTTTAPEPTIETPTTTEPTTEEPPTTEPTTEEPPSPDENESVEVDFGQTQPENQTTSEEGEEGEQEEVNVSVETVSPEEIPEPTNTSTEGPDAVINAEDDDETESSAGREQLQVNDTRVNEVTNEGDTIELEGDQSLLDSSGSIDVERRIAKAVNISVPREYERRSANIRIRVARSKLGDTKPENARIGHRTDEGWQLLDTRVVERTPDSVVLQARTPSFSPFAVFRSPDVTYEWTLPNGTTYTGPEVRSAFNDPGIYNVSLTVTDAFGRTNTTQYEILVNDVPSVQLHAPASVDENESVTLTANVTNQFGNATVTWLLPNGKQATGTSVETNLPEGVHSVEVRVRDEFGATATTTETIYVGVAPADSGLQSLLVGPRAPLVTLLGLFVVLAGLYLVVGRALRDVDGVPRPKLPVPWRRSRSPRITAFENPHWEPVRGHFEIETLEVQDPDDDLQVVEITISRQDGTELARKTIDIRATDRYRAEPAAIPGITFDDVDRETRCVARVHAVDEDENERYATKAIRAVLPQAQADVLASPSG